MAVTQYYVDYGAGNDTTGDGTVGTPWKTIQKALDTITRNSTDGDQINVKAGTAQVLGASLTLATYGTPAYTAPLIIRGYTSAANDGGMAEIDCNGATMWAATTYDSILLVDLKLHNFGNNNGCVLDSYCMLMRCEVYRGVSTPSSKFLVSLGANCAMIGCYLHDPGTLGSCVYSNDVGVLLYGNTIYASDNSSYGIQFSNAYGAVITNNIIKCSDTSATGVLWAGGSSGYWYMTNNAVVNTTAGTGNGVYAGNFAGRSAGVVTNNIIAGWSGAGGVGLKSLGDAYVLGYNAYYNNTTALSIADQKFIDLTAGDVTLAADPFTDAANGDFSLTEAGKAALRSLGWPSNYLGAHANTDAHITIGPMQYGPTPAAGGGGRPAFGDRTGGKF